MACADAHGTVQRYARLQFDDFCRVSRQGNLFDLLDADNIAAHGLIWFHGRSLGNDYQFAEFYGCFLEYDIHCGGQFDLHQYILYIFGAVAHQGRFHFMHARIDS